MRFRADPRTSIVVGRVSFTVTQAAAPINVHTTNATANGRERQAIVRLVAEGQRGRLTLRAP